MDRQTGYYYMSIEKLIQTLLHVIQDKQKLIQTLLHVIQDR